MAVIKLDSLHDVFSKLPLIRGSYLKLTVNLNTECSCVIKQVINDANCNYLSYTSTCKNDVLPMTISAMDGGNGYAPITVGTDTAVNGVNVPNKTGDTLTMTLNVARATLNNNVFTHNIQQCRLYMKTYDFCALKLQQYLLELPRQRVCYEDIFFTKLSEIPSGGDISQILFHSVPRIKSIVLIPQVSSKTHTSGITADSRRAINCNTNSNSNDDHLFQVHQ